MKRLFERADILDQLGLLRLAAVAHVDLKASAPASTSALIISGLDEAGPSVANIFTLRARGLSIVTLVCCAPAIAVAPCHSTGLRRGLASPSEPAQYFIPMRFEEGETK